MGEILDKGKFGRYAMVVAAALVLLTTYLAILFAPLPQTSVRSADEILSDVQGSGIQVAGFVSEVFSRQVSPDGSQTIRLSLADFSDYRRYLDNASAGTLDSQWWTVRPIDVELHVDATDVSRVNGLKDGANVSVTATVARASIGINSNASGYSLRVAQGKDVVIGTSPGEFGIMTAPVAQKIFYFHMPSAWVSYLAFFTTLLFSAMYLRSRDVKYDRWASSSAELGVLFATIAILTGPIWAKQEWGVYWRWNDTKLVTTFILWLVYIGYLMLRGSVPDPNVRARVASVYGILGFVTVPLSLLSARIAPLLQSSHPEVIASGSGGLSPAAGMTIGVAVTAFTFLFITMLIKRVEIAESEETLEELKRMVGGEE
jgi:heme exporter protein C